MVKWDSSKWRKDFSKSTNQSMWYITLTNWRIKSTRSSKSVQVSCSVVSDSLRPHGLQHVRLPCPSLSSQSMLRLMSIELVMPSNHLILCHHLLFLPSVFPSIRDFSNELVLCIMCPKDWSFSFTVSPSSEHSGLISFRMDWLDCLAVQGTLKCLLQHHSSKASIFCRSTFFMVQLSHPYMTIGKPQRWLYGSLSAK